MNRWVPPLCVLASIGALCVTVAAYYQLRKTVTHHYQAVAAAVPSNVTRLDSRRKAGESVTVLRSVKP